MTEAATQAPPLTAEQRRQLGAWTTHYPYPIMGILEAMRQVQQWHLCITPDDEDAIAVIFKTTRSHVHQLATFFPFFTQAPTGRRRVGLCRGVSCAMEGSAKMAACLERTLGAPEGVTTADGEFSWETMECLGACDFAPALIVNEELKGKATEPLVAELVKRR